MKGLYSERGFRIISHAMVRVADCSMGDSITRAGMLLSPMT